MNIDNLSAILFLGKTSNIRALFAAKSLVSVVLTDNPLTSNLLLKNQGNLVN
ncbi:MAG TPA: hypothetical protein VJ729_10835 [Nitrososphaeraceae archaeon]|nr:hypothetical protein [Nitrososphaeraceae archaeon]